jgi:hypothetical protein
MRTFVGLLAPVLLAFVAPPLLAQALESLSGPHEARWINTFASEADTARVARVYAASRVLSDALGGVATRKAALIGAPIQGFASYRAELSRGPAWPIARSRSS